MSIKPAVVMESKRVLEEDNSFLDVYQVTNPDLLRRCSQEVADQLWIEPTIRLFNRDVAQPRDVGFFSDTSKGYRYSRKMMESKPLTPALADLLDWVNLSLNSNFNGILVNRYRDGTRCIGAHRDDEDSLDDCGVVAISCGATRKFRIRYATTKKIAIDVPLVDGEMIQMGGDFQKVFTHEIPRELKIKEARISFTFRKHLE